MFFNCPGKLSNSLILSLQAEIQTDLSQKLDKATVALATGKQFSF